MKRKNIFKSLLAAAMALIMIFGAAPLSGFVGIRLPMLSLKAEAATTEDGLFEYAVDRRWTESGYQDGVRIIRCNKKGPGKVVVPETIKGLEVKWIDGAAFGGCTRITSIVTRDYGPRGERVRAYRRRCFRRSYLQSYRQIRNERNTVYAR